MQRDATRIFGLAGVLAAVIAVGAIAQLFWPGANLLNPRGYYIGQDFLNIWGGGRLALQGDVRTIYDLELYNAWLKIAFAPADRFMLFSYPPAILPLLLPLGAMPYLVALALWTLAGAVLFLYAALGRRGMRELSVLQLVLVLSPVVMVNIVFGQLGLVLAGVFIGVMRLLPERPRLAGALTGLFVVKPQLALLFPIVFLMFGAWRAIFAAAAVSLGLCALSVVLYGIEPWQIYLTRTAGYQMEFVREMNGFFVFQMTTVYGTLRGLGLNYAQAMAGHIAIAAIILAATLWALLQEFDWPLKAALVAVAAVCMPPYLLAYDLAIPFAALAWYVTTARTPLTGWQRAVVLAAWAAPFAVLLRAQSAGVPIGGAVVTALFAALIKQAFDEARDSHGQLTPAEVWPGR